MSLQLSGDGTIVGLTAGGLPDSSIVTADIADTNITGAKLSGAQSGTAPVFGVRAWAAFNGTTTGTNPPTAGGNVTSIQRTSAGTYAVLFTTAMPHANYAIHVTARNNPNAVIAYAVDGVPTVNGFGLITLTAAPALADSDYVTFTVTC